MNIVVKNISSLEKIRCSSISDVQEIESLSLLKGEHLSYQVVISSESINYCEIEVSSKLDQYISVYSVKNAIMDFPKHKNTVDKNYITDEPGLMPDILMPLEEQNNIVRLNNGFATLWIDICLPENFTAGKYNVNVNISSNTPVPPHAVPSEPVNITKQMEIEVIDAVLPKQQTMFTQWIHLDCISSVYNIPVFSDEHWSLIKKYVKMAADTGINLIMTPVITPPLDTAPNTRRACTQLVKIKKEADVYTFDFSLLDKWITLCKKYGIENFEICPLFSQWGLEYAPNILVEENGKEEYKFGWHVKAQDESYKHFLNAFLPALVNHLKKMGIFENCYFHISDEPSKEHIANYMYAYNVIKPLIGTAKTIDALSNIDFYEKGLVDNPVCCIAEIEPFIEKNVENLWGYYCNTEGEKVSNRFLSMPMSRNRIIGLQMYKFGIVGFLHWGYNFYFSQYSKYEIDAFTTTSADGAYPSGDSFSVYPGKHGPLLSTRAMVFREALQDIELCRLLEKKIGKEKVVELIESEAGMKITFCDYPHNNQYIPSVTSKIKQLLAEI